MRKSLVVSVVGAIVVALGTAIVALWLPAYHARQNTKWNQTSERALATVALPAGFHPHDDAGTKSRICVPNVDQQCYWASDDPRDLVTPLTSALRPVATAPIRSHCVAVPIPNSPASCDLEVPVDGGALTINVFSRIVQNGQPFADASWRGSYVEVRVHRR
jgi:hypothetical protein